MTEAHQMRDLSLTRLPRPAMLGEYEEAASEIEERLRDLPGMVAVYRTGSVSAPGISDLDRVAVVEEGVRASSVWRGLSPKTRYLAMHAPFLVDLPSFVRHRWFAHVEPLDRAFGAAVEVEDRPLEPYSEPLLAAESLVTSLLSCVKQVSTGLFKVRPSLCQLNNLRHGLVLARLDREHAPSAWGLVDDVADLRGGWFTKAEPDRSRLAKDVARRAVPSLREALWALGERSESQEVRGEMKLGPPWSNVTLTAGETASDAVSGTPRFRVPLIRSARIAEVTWRASKPRVALHPAVMALLSGASRQREVANFRLVRDDLVRSYRDFLAPNSGYAALGLAFPFHDARDCR